MPPVQLLVWFVMLLALVLALAALAALGLSVGYGTGWSGVWRMFDKRLALIAVGIAVGMSVLGLGLAKYGAEFQAAGLIKPLWLGVATLTSWGLGAALAVAATGQMRWGVLTCVLMIVVHSWLGNAVISAVHDGEWTMNPFEPPYYVSRALLMNLVLGVIPGVAGGIVGKVTSKVRGVADGEIAR